MIIIKTLKGRQYKLNLAQYIRNDRESQSSLHTQVRELIQYIFPASILAEEVYIPGEKLYLDFLLPDKMLCVEVHGRQHYEYVEHFHKNKINFVQSKKRDLRKSEWCKLNNISLVVLPYNESIEQWRDRLVNYWNCGESEEGD